LIATLQLIVRYSIKRRY